MALGACLCVALICVAGAARARAAELTPTQTFSAPDSSADNAYGQAVAVSGNTMVVGAPNDGDGMAWVYTRDSAGVWGQPQALTFEGGRAEDFGDSVAIGGGTIVVGAPEASSINEGSASVFTQVDGSWQLLQTIAPIPDMNVPPQYMNLGQSVAISPDGSTIAIGDPQQNGAFVYTLASGGYDQAGFIDEPTSMYTPSGSFGDAVAISGQTVFVGDPDLQVSDDSGAGSVFGFVADGPASDPWSSTTQTAELVSATTSGQFGYALAAQGNTLVVGAPGVGEAGVTGAVGAGFVYDVGSGGTATPVTELQPGLTGGTNVYSEYGASLAIDGSAVLLGAGESNALADPCLFSLGGSTGVCEAVPDANEGGGVALSGGTVAVGAPITDEGTSTTGDLEIFSQPASSISLALSPSSIIANGTSTSTATATVDYPSGDSAPDEDVTFSASPAGATIGPVTNNGDGTYTATITSSTTAGPVTITATDAAADLDTTATLTETAPPPTGGSGGAGGSGGGTGTPTGSGGSGSGGTGGGGAGGSPSPTPPTRRQLLSGLGAPTGHDATIKAILSYQHFAMTYKVLEAGTVKVSWDAKVGHKQVVIATVSRRVTAAGSVMLTVKLTSAGRALLKRSAKLKVSYTDSFTPTGKKAIATTGSFTLH